MNDKAQIDKCGITLDAEFKKKLKEYAKYESRSLNSFILNAIKFYIKHNFEDK